MKLTEEKLAKLLRGAEKAHGEYEKTLGTMDENRAEWYATYIIKRML
jgi:hypothetical protein